MQYKMIVNEVRWLPWLHTCRTACVCVYIYIINNTVIYCRVAGIIFVYTIAT